MPSAARWTTSPTTSRGRVPNGKALDAWRRDLDGLYDGGDAGQAGFLLEAVDRFHLEKADFLAVIDGMAMDVEADIVAPLGPILDLCARPGGQRRRPSVG